VDLNSLNPDTDSGSSISSESGSKALMTKIKEEKIQLKMVYISDDFTSFIK
jgi:hypothetical protein